jgi:hypothetical protein
MESFAGLTKHAQQTGEEDGLPRMRALEGRVGEGCSQASWLAWPPNPGLSAATRSATSKHPLGHPTVSFSVCASEPRQVRYISFFEAPASAKMFGSTGHVRRFLPQEYYTISKHAIGQIYPYAHKGVPL